MGSIIPDVRQYFGKRLYRLCVVGSWIVLLWGIFSNGSLLSPYINKNTEMTKRDPRINNQTDKPIKPKPIRSVADRFFHVDANKDSKSDAFVSILKNNIHLISAVGMNSSREKYYDQIVLSGWERRQASSDIFRCCLVYNDSLADIYLTKMTEKRDWSYLGMAKFEVKQYVCPNVFHQQYKVPIGVTLSVGKVCSKDLSTYVKVDLPVSLPGEKLGVCAKLVYGNISASAMTEWFEYQQLMGVSKVIAYTYKLSTDAIKVLQYYVVTGLAEFYPFSLPMQDEANREVGVKNFQSWNDEQLTAFDCAVKLSGYKYIGLYDMDEFIYPKLGDNLPQLMRELLKKYPRAAGFTFKTEVYATTWGTSKNASNFPGLFLGSYDMRTDAFNDRVKSMIVQDRMMPGRLSTHGYWAKSGYKKCLVSKDDAVLKHYRSCRKEWLRNSGEKCFKLIQRVHDPSMFKYATQIMGRVKAVKDLVKIT